MLFQDRTEAGRRLAERLNLYANQTDVLVLALPRGGVPVGFEVARTIKAPLDVFLVRKLGVPGHEELGMGAIATGDIRVLNEDLIRDLRISPAAIEQVTQRERQELARREILYRSNRPVPDVRDKAVILVDDGLATGFSMYTAVTALHKLQPSRIVIAVPVAASSIYREFQHSADELICLATPEPFGSVGTWYHDFTQTTDDDVRHLLDKAIEDSSAFTTS